MTNGRETKKILIAEDEVIVADDIANTIRGFGYEVAGTARSGSEAVKIAKKERPDIALLDIRLKGKIDGVDVAEKIKEFGIPSVYLTAYSDEKTVERAKKTEPLGFIMKPFDNKELGSVLEIAFYKSDTENKIRESEERFRSFFDNMTSGVAIYRAVKGGEDFIICDMNRAGEKISNVKKEEIEGKGIQEVFPGVKEMGLFDVLKRVFRSGRAEVFPVSRYKDKKIMIWAENHVFKLSGGEVVAIYRDLTEYVRTNEKLKESEERYKIISDITSQLIYDYDIPSGRISWQGLPGDIIGYTKEEIDKINIEEWKRMIHPDDLGKTMDLLKKAEETIGKFYAEYKFRHKNGDYVYIKDRGIFFSEDGKKADRMIGSMQNVTSIVLFEKELEKRNNELERSNRIMVGRELRMIDLKKRIKELEDKLKSGKDL